MRNPSSAIFISDTHLAAWKALAAELIQLLQSDDSTHTFLVGDIVDIWAINQAKKLSLASQRDHNRCITTLLDRALDDRTVTYVWGNHDEFLSQFEPYQAIQNIRLCEKTDYVASDGRKYLVIHGHQFDIMSRFKYSALIGKIGDTGYDFLIKINGVYNKIRKLFGFGYHSLSKMIKVKVKKATFFIQNFEKALCDYARTHGYDGVICGHIHEPADRMVNGIHYLNCGCWTDLTNLSYIKDIGDNAGLKLCFFRPE
jgi:UDP-2,3-diacylglucosamine pyrophosphatase LpxH